MLMIEDTQREKTVVDTLKNGGDHHHGHAHGEHGHAMMAVFARAICVLVVAVFTGATAQKTPFPSSAPTAWKDLMDKADTAGD